MSGGAEHEENLERLINELRRSGMREVEIARQLGWVPSIDGDAAAVASSACAFLNAVMVGRPNRFSFPKAAATLRAEIHRRRDAGCDDGAATPGRARHWDVDSRTLPVPAPSKTLPRPATCQQQQNIIRFLIAPTCPPDGPLQPAVAIPPNSPSSSGSDMDSDGHVRTMPRFWRLVAARKREGASTSDVIADLEFAGANERVLTAIANDRNRICSSAAACTTLEKKLGCTPPVRDELARAGAFWLSREPAGSSLFSLLTGPATPSSIPMDAELACHIAETLAEALRFLHLRGLCHGAIDWNHVFVKTNPGSPPDVKLVGLDTIQLAENARRLHSLRARRPPTVDCSPDAWKDDAFNDSTRLTSAAHFLAEDMWQLGVLLHRVLFGGRLPFGLRDASEQADVLAAFDRPFRPDPARSLLGREVAHLHTAVSQLLTLPAERMAAHELDRFLTHHAVLVQLGDSCDATPPARQAIQGARASVVSPHGPDIALIASLLGHGRGGTDASLLWPPHCAADVRSALENMPMNTFKLLVPVLVSSTTTPQSLIDSVVLRTDTFNPDPDRFDLLVDLVYRKGELKLPTYDAVRQALAQGSNRRVARVRTLVRYWCDIDAFQDGSTAASVTAALASAGSLDSCMTMLNHTKDIEPIVNACKFAFIGASENGQTAVCEALFNWMSQRPDVFQKSRVTEIAMKGLEMACKHSTPEIIAICVRHSSALAAPFDHLENATCAHICAQVGHAASLCALFVRKHPATRDLAKAKMDRSVSPLHLAAFNGHEEACRILVEYGAEPGATDDDAWTPLHLAAMRGHGSICALLLDAGATVDSELTDNTTPIELAAWKGHYACVRDHLLPNGGELNPSRKRGAHRTAYVELLCSLARATDDLNHGSSPRDFSARVLQKLAVVYPVHVVIAMMVAASTDQPWATFGAFCGALVVHVVSVALARSAVVSEEAAAGDARLQVSRFAIDEILRAAEADVEVVPLSPAWNAFAALCAHGAPLCLRISSSLATILIFVFLGKLMYTEQGAVSFDFSRTLADRCIDTDELHCTTVLNTTWLLQSNPDCCFGGTPEAASCPGDVGTIPIGPVPARRAQTVFVRSAAHNSAHPAAIVSIETCDTSQPRPTITMDTFFESSISDWVAWALSILVIAGGVLLFVSQLFTSRRWATANSSRYRLAVRHTFVWSAARFYILATLHTVVAGLCGIVAVRFLIDFKKPDFSTRNTTPLLAIHLGVLSTYPGLGIVTWVPGIGHVAAPILRNAYLVVVGVFVASRTFDLIPAIGSLGISDLAHDLGEPITAVGDATTSRTFYVLMCVFWLALLFRVLLALVSLLAPDDARAHYQTFFRESAVRQARQLGRPGHELERNWPQTSSSRWD